MTTEKNEFSAEAPTGTIAGAADKPTAGNPVQEKDKKLGSGCLIAFLAMVTLLFLILCLLPPFGRVRPETVAFDCRSILQTVYRSMPYYLSKFEGDGRELPPDWTIPVMVQEMYENDGRNWSYFSCPVDGHRDPYLAFPAPVSVLLNQAEQKPVPILMCRPGSHGKYGTNVLYSDGTVKILTTEEAEKLVAEQSPVPLKLQKTEYMIEQEAEP